MSSTKLVFFRANQKQKQDDHHDIWLAETFSTSLLKPLNWIQWNLTGGKIWMSYTILYSWRPIG